MTSRLCWMLYQCAEGTKTSPSVAGKQRYSGRTAIQSPEPMHLSPVADPAEMESNVQCLGSIMQDDCGSDIQVDSRIRKASKAIRSMCHILWYQRAIKTSTKLHIFNAVVVATQPFDRESLVLLEPQIHRLKGFVMRCLRIILGVSVREKKCYTSIWRMAKQQRHSSMLFQS